MVTLLSNGRTSCLPLTRGVHPPIWQISLWRGILLLQKPQLPTRLSLQYQPPPKTKSGCKSINHRSQKRFLHPFQSNEVHNSTKYLKWDCIFTKFLKPDLRRSSPAAYLWIIQIFLCFLGDFCFVLFFFLTGGSSSGWIIILVATSVFMALLIIDSHGTTFPSVNGFPIGNYEHL